MYNIDIETNEDVIMKTVCEFIDLIKTGSITFNHENRDEGSILAFNTLTCEGFEIIYQKIVDANGVIRRSEDTNIDEFHIECMDFDVIDESGDILDKFDIGEICGRIMGINKLPIDSII